MITLDLSNAVDIDKMEKYGTQFLDAWLYLRYEDAHDMGAGDGEAEAEMHEAANWLEKNAPGMARYLYRRIAAR